MSSSSVLERRYRRLLTVLPEAYRAARGEELLAVLMDKSGPRQQWPTLGEAFSLTGLGIRVRIGAEREPGASTGGTETIRVVALLSVLLLGIDGVVQAGLMARFNAQFGLSDSAVKVGWQRVLGSYAEAGWLLAYVALVSGLRRTGRTICAVLGASTVIISFIPSPFAVGPASYEAFYNLVPYLLAAGATALSFRPGAAPVRHRRRWLAALAPAAVVGATEFPDLVPAVFGWSSPGLGFDAVIAVLLVSAAAAVCVQAWHSPVWPIAAATTVLGSSAPVLLTAMTDPYVTLRGFGLVAAAMGVGFVALSVLSVGRRWVVRRARVDSEHRYS